jgi:flagellar protein FlaG
MGEVAPSPILFFHGGKNMDMKVPGITGSGVPPELLLSRHENVPGTEARTADAPELRPVYSRESLERSAEILEQTFRLFNKRLKFSVNEEIDRVIVKVVDATTDKVIKEIPPEEMQRLIARIRETIGLLFDQKI